MKRIKLKYEFNLIRDVRNTIGDMFLVFLVCSGMCYWYDKMISEQIELLKLVLVVFGGMIVLVTIVDAIVYLVNANTLKHGNTDKSEKRLLLSDMINWADWDKDDEIEVWNLYIEKLRGFITKDAEEFLWLKTCNIKTELSEKQILSVLDIYNMLYNESYAPSERFLYIYKYMQTYMNEYLGEQERYLSFTEIKVLYTILLVTRNCLLK